MAIDGAAKCLEVSGTRQVLQHLISLGHKRIAYANNGPQWNTHPSVSIRHQTYLAVLPEHGLRPMPLHDAATDAPAHDFVRRVAEAGATAILAYHHFNAVYVMQAAAQLGISIPGQMSLACFNDEYPLQFLHPQVTAVAMPAADAGKIAAETLMAQMGKHVREGKTFVLKPTLMVRESTIAPVKR